MNRKEIAEKYGKSNTMYANTCNKPKQNSWAKQFRKENILWWRRKMEMEIFCTFTIFCIFCTTCTTCTACTACMFCLPIFHILYILHILHILHVLHILYILHCLHFCIFSHILHIIFPTTSLLPRYAYDRFSSSLSRAICHRK